MFQEHKHWTYMWNDQILFDVHQLLYSSRSADMRNQIRSHVKLPCLVVDTDLLLCSQSASVYTVKVRILYTGGCLYTDS